MRLKSLQYFLVVAEELSITRAAERLYITQQALSEQINKLEQDYRVELFTRGRSLALTYAGKCLLGAAMQMLDLDKQLRARFDDLREETCGELSFGISYSRARCFLPRVLARFNKAYPNVDFHVKTGSSEALQKMLLNGSADIILGFDNFSTVEIKKIKLKSERLYVTVAHELLRRTLGGATGGKAAPAVSGGGHTVVRVVAFSAAGAG